MRERKRERERERERESERDRERGGGARREHDTRSSTCVDEIHVDGEDS